MAADNKTNIVISAQDNASAVLKDIGKNVLSLGDAAALIKGKMGAIGAAVSVAGFGAMIAETVKAQGELHDLSQATGATVEALSGIAPVAKLSNTSLEQVGAGLQKLTKNMNAAASGSVEQQALFKALGVSVTDSSGRLRDSGAVMQDLAKSISGLQSPTERVAAAQLAFGKSGAQLVPMLNDLAVAGDLVVKTTAAQAAMADNIGDNMTRLGTVYQGTGKIIVNEFLPTIDAFVETLLEAAKESGGFKGAIKDLAKDGTLKEWAESAGMGVARLVDVLQVAAGNVALVGKAIAAASAMTMAKNPVESKAIWEAFKADFDKAMNPELFSEKLAKNAKDPWRGWVEKEKEYAQNAGRVMAAYASYPIEIQQQAMRALAKSEFTDGDSFAKRLENENAKLKPAVDEFAALMARINAKDKGVDAGYFKDVATLKEALDSGRIGVEQYSQTVSKLYTQQKAYQDAVKKTADAQAELKKTAEDLDKLGIKEIEDLGKAIAAQRLHNEEIGKTAEQKELAKRLAFESVTSTLEEESANLRLAVSAGAVADAYVGMYLQRANALDIEIEKRRELAGLIGNAAVLEKRADDAKKFGEEWKKISDDIGRSLTDGIYRGLEQGGREGAQVAQDTIKNTLKAIPIRLAVDAVINPITSSLQSAVTGTAAATTPGLFGNSGSLSSTLSAGGSLYNFATGNIGTGGLYGAFATSSVGQSIGLSTAVASEVGPTLGLSTMGAAMPYVAAALAVGSALGLFGGKKNNDNYYRFSGLANDGSATRAGWKGGPNGEVYDFYGSGGSTFRAMPDDMRATLGKTIESLFASMEKSAKSVGMSTAGLEGLTVATHSTGKGVEADVTNALTEISAAIATTLIPNLKDFQVQGESLADTFGRVTADIGVVKDLFATLGQTMTGDTATLAEAVASQFGGTANLQTAWSAYFKDFYSETERIARATQKLTESFSTLGISMPSSREAFRSLVEAQDLTTEAGQKMFSSLMTLAPAFAAVVAATENTTAALAAMEKQSAATQAGLIDNYGSPMSVADARQSVASANLGLSINDLIGESADDLRKTFHDLARGMDPTTEAGRAAIAALGGLGKAIDVLVSDAQRAAAEIESARGVQSSLISSYALPLTVDDAVAKIQKAGLGLDGRALAGQPANEIRGSISAAVSAADPETEAGRARLAGLQKLSDAFNTLIGAAENAAAEQQRQIEEAARAAEQQRQDAARLADEQTRAAEQVRQAWQTAAESVVEAVKKIRGDILGNTRQGFAAAQTDFSIATAQAQAGDQEAFKKLPQLANSVADLAATVAGSQVEEIIIKAKTMASLEQTLRRIAGGQGIALPAFAAGTNYVPADMVAQIHQGERIIPAADNRALMDALRGGNVIDIAPLLNEIALLRAEVRAGNGAIAMNTRDAADVLSEASRGARSIFTRATA